MPKQTYYIEDCIEGMQHRIDAGSVDLVFADPPFNIGFNKMSSIYKYGVSVDKDIYYRDEMTREEYIQWSGKWMEGVKKILRKDGVFILMSGWNNVSYIEVKAHETGFETLNHVIWHYEFGPQTKRKFVTSHYHYLILLNGKITDNGWTFNKTKHYEEDVFNDIRRLTKKYVGIKHPCKLNEEVHEKFFNIFTNDGDLVVDIFMGAGTSMVAAANLNLNYVGFEIKPRYKAKIEKMMETRLMPSGQTMLEEFMVNKTGHRKKRVKYFLT